MVDFNQTSKGSFATAATLAALLAAGPVAAQAQTPGAVTPPVPAGSEQLAKDPRSELIEASPNQFFIKARAPNGNLVAFQYSGTASELRAGNKAADRFYDLNNPSDRTRFRDAYTAAGGSGADADRYAGLASASAYTPATTPAAAAQAPKSDQQRFSDMRQAGMAVLTNTHHAFGKDGNSGYHFILGEDNQTVINAVRYDITPGSRGEQAYNNDVASFVRVEQQQSRQAASQSVSQATRAEAQRARTSNMPAGTAYGSPEEVYQRLRSSGDFREYRMNPTGRQGFGVENGIGYHFRLNNDGSPASYKPYNLNNPRENDQYNRLLQQAPVQQRQAEDQDARRTQQDANVLGRGAERVIKGGPGNVIRGVGDIISIIK